MAKKQNFIHGAAILTVGVIIMKLLGFIYKIPLGNILDDEGYSMFTSAYSISSSSRWRRRVCPSRSRGSSPRPMQMAA